MLFEQMLELCRDKKYEVDIKFQQRFTYVKVTDTEHGSQFADFRVSSDLLTMGVATKVMSRICMYEHDAMEYNPDALLSAETLAKLSSYTDEVSEARMSYYWVHNSDMWPVRIEVKVDEYREVVSARYVKVDEDICPGCAGYGIPCSMYHGTQAQLDESTWVKVDNCTNLLPTEHQLIQKVAANDN